MRLIWQRTIHGEGNRLEANGQSVSVGSLPRPVFAKPAREPQNPITIQTSIITMSQVTPQADLPTESPGRTPRLRGWSTTDGGWCGGLMLDQTCSRACAHLTIATGDAEWVAKSRRRGPAVLIYWCPLYVPSFGTSNRSGERYWIWPL